jgi:hypothetical protein
LLTAALPIQDPYLCKVQAPHSFDGLLKPKDCNPLTLERLAAVHRVALKLRLGKQDVPISESSHLIRGRCTKMNCRENKHGHPNC